MNRIKLLIIIALVSVMALDSCKSSKSAAPSTTPAVPEVVEQKPVETLAATYGRWTDVKMPLKIELQQPTKFSVSGNLTMTAGQAIGISLRMFGMEVGNVYVDADSVLAVVKPMGMFYAESTAKFTAAAGFGLPDIQTLLLGRAFVPGSGQLNAAMAPDFKAERLPDAEYLLMPVVQPDGYGYFYTAEFGSAPVATGLAVEISGHNPVLCNFADFRTTPAGTVAEKIRLRASVRDHNLECSLTTNAAKAEWNKGNTVRRPSIPSGAHRMTTAQLLSMLKGL